MNLIFTEPAGSVRMRTLILRNHSTLKLLMRISFFYVFLVLLSMQLLLARNGNSQGLEDINVTLEMHNANLKEVFQKIEKQTGLLFAYQPQQVNVYAGINLEKSTRSVKELLDLVLENTTLTYQLVNKSVIILKKQDTVNAATLTATEAQQRTADDGLTVITGKVVDKETMVPVPGVSVIIKGTILGTATDSEGKYTIEAKDTDILVFSFIGFHTFEAPVNGRSTIDVTLEVSIASLDEVVVIGYGTTTKRIATGSVTRVTADDIAGQPVTNVLQALQGRMPGVSITQTNGLPGAGITVQIRGENSIAKGNQPLYIVDGVPYLSTPINQQSTTSSVLPSAEGNTSPLNSINPADIESIDILKDADATAIYGSRGANGVVLITTKKGKSGKSQFIVNASTGSSKVTNYVKTLDTEEYLRLRALGIANNGKTPTTSSDQDLTIWDQTAYTDFQKLLTGNTAHTSEANASLSGGDQHTVFFFSGTMHHETNVFSTNQYYRRSAFNLNVNHTTANDKLKIGVSAIYSADKNKINQLDMMNTAYIMPPNFPLYKDDGSLYWTGSILGTKNPLGYLRQTNSNKTSNLMSNVNLRYTVLPGLDLKTMVGYSRTDMDQASLYPMSSQDPGITSNVARSNFSYNVTSNYIVEPQAIYSRHVWKGKLDALAGGTWQFQDSKQPFYVISSGYISDKFISNLGSATTKSVSSTSSQYKYASLFGRLTYNIDNKYIANINFRRDGSSRFGPSNKFGNFGSVGAAWLFSEEDFVKDLGLSWFSFGKLRGSYGVVGSDNIANYQYLESYQTTSYVYNGSTGLVPSRISNSDFKWEETEKIEGALELGFLQDRILLTSAYYRNRTNNQLLNYPLSPQTGFTAYQSNLPATVQNEGWEFTVSTKNIQRGDFTWNTSINFSQNRNKLVSYPGIETSSYYYTYKVGQPISSYKLYNYIGINETTGLPKVEDVDGSGTINSYDRHYAGPMAPKFFGGMNNTLSWKRFTLDFTFQFVKQNGYSLLQSSNVPSYYLYNTAADIVKDYLELGDESKLVSTNVSAWLAYSNYAGSQKALVDASFIRLKNASLSYSLPATWLARVKMQSARVYVQGQNLLTITSYEGFDPESRGVVTPPLRTISAGLQFTF